jgi:hypothetical protein
MDVTFRRGFYFNVTYSQFIFFRVDIIVVHVVISIYNEFEKELFFLLIWVKRDSASHQYSK